jgi:hypothetical protein
MALLVAGLTLEDCYQKKEVALILAGGRGKRMDILCY